jgi:hypothetical protein
LIPPPVIRESDLRSAVNWPGWAAEYEGTDRIGQATRLATGIARVHGFLDGDRLITRVPCEFLRQCCLDRSAEFHL